MSKVVLVLPAYNESKAIVEVINKSLKHINDIIVVDDGSSDATAELVEKLPVTLIRNFKNLGKGAALFKGFAQANAHQATHVITMDGDSQHDPDDIPRLVQAINEYSNSIIVAARLRNTQAAPKSRLLANKIADFFISWAAGQKVYDSQSGFRVYPIGLLNSFQKHYHHQHSFVFESEIFIEATRQRCSIAALAIDSYYPEDARDSHFQPARDICAITRMIAKKIILQGFNLPGLGKAIFSKGSLLNR